MTGPSAMGSENGTPISMTSAPASSRARRSSTERCGVGWPAVMYGTSAFRPCRASAAKRSRNASEEVVTDSDAIPLGVFGFDDRAPEDARRGLLREVCQLPRVQDVSAIVAHDAHDGSRDGLRVGIHRMDDRQLERIEHDQ